LASGAAIRQEAGAARCGASGKPVDAAGARRSPTELIQYDHERL